MTRQMKKALDMVVRLHSKGMSLKNAIYVGKIYLNEVNRR